MIGGVNVIVVVEPVVDSAGNLFLHVAGGCQNLCFVVGDQKVEQVVELVELFLHEQPLDISHRIGHTLKNAVGPFTGGNMPGTDDAGQTHLMNAGDVVFSGKMEKFILFTGKDIKKLYKFCRHFQIPVDAFLNAWHVPHPPAWSGRS